MTKTFCDRCGNEAAVLSLSLRTTQRTEAVIEACQPCVAAVVAVMKTLVGRAEVSR